MIKDYTKISPYFSCFDLNPTDLITLGAQRIKLKELSSLDEFIRVICRAIVTKQTEPQMVGGGKTKQDITIKDDTGSATLTMWEKDVDSLNLGESYQFNRIVVRSFKGKTNLSLPPSGASVQPIDDLSAVSETEESDHEGDDVLVGAKVSGVHQLENIYLIIIMFALQEGKIVMSTREHFHM